MAKRSQFKMSVSERQHRTFSVGFKKSKVKEIESGKTTVNEVCKEYEVSSTAVYNWLKQYGLGGERPVRMVVETLSDTRELLRLKQQVAELERTVGQKQILLDFKDKMIELAEHTYGVDIKKKFSTTPSDISGSTGSITPSV